jgi:hypothetical protein|tara:strand:- start:554 stop:844 length:291 start_codon:yes stop_codon:yes gene_type:complete
MNRLPLPFAVCFGFVAMSIHFSGGNGNLSCFCDGAKAIDGVAGKGFGSAGYSSSAAESANEGCGSAEGDGGAVSGDDVPGDGDEEHPITVRPEPDV